jgi:hypothetical protein
MLRNRNIITEFDSMRGGTQHSPQNGDPAGEQVIRAGESSPAMCATLQSWKEIASELNCGVRTAQRWERTLGMPVRRIGNGRGHVVAFNDELQRWLRDRAKGPATPKVGLLASITDFLARGPSSAKQICDQCHSPMKFLDGQFWIYGTTRKWNLSVPFCPLCEAEAFESFCRSQIIH